MGQDEVIAMATRNLSDFMHATLIFPSHRIMVEELKKQNAAISDEIIFKISAILRCEVETARKMYNL